MIYYAREDQTLAEHIENTAKLAEKFSGVFGCANTAYTIGLLHDVQVR